MMAALEGRRLTAVSRWVYAQEFVQKERRGLVVEDEVGRYQVVLDGRQHDCWSDPRSGARYLVRPVKSVECDGEVVLGAHQVGYDGASRRLVVLNRSKVILQQTEPLTAMWVVG